MYWPNISVSGVPKTDETLSQIVENFYAKNHYDIESNSVAQYMHTINKIHSNQTRMTPFSKNMCCLS